MERKYYVCSNKGRMPTTISTIVFFLIRLLFDKNSFEYWFCNVCIVIGLIAFISTFTLRTSLENDGFKETTFGFWKRMAKWEEIEALIMFDKKHFSIGAVGKGKLLIGCSSFWKDYEKLARELLKICEEKYPHIQIDPEIYKELEKAEGRKAMNQWRIEQVKKFFTRSKD